MIRHKILVPTDFSKTATKAMHCVLKLYKKNPCYFYLQNVFTAGDNILGDLMNMKPGTEFYERKKIDSENDLAKICDRNYQIQIREP